MKRSIEELIAIRTKELLLVDPRNGGGARMFEINKDLEVLKRAQRGDVSALPLVELIEAQIKDTERKKGLFQETFRPVDPSEFPKLGS
jgi:hypothetical protein